MFKPARFYALSFIFVITDMSAAQRVEPKRCLLSCSMGESYIGNEVEQRDLWYKTWVGPPSDLQAGKYNI